MNRIALAVLCLIASLAAQAQIYQYKDAAGRTVYSDQPPTSGASNARTVSKEPAGSTAPSTTAPAPKSKSMAEREMEFQKRQKEQQEAAEKAEKENSANTTRKDDCERAKRALQTLQSGERVSVRDESGERAVIDDAQRASEAERMRKAVAEICK